MTDALKRALVASTVTVAIIATALSYDPRQGPAWLRAALMIAFFAVPLAGGAMAAIKGAADRRAGRSPGQTWVALGLAIALITLGAGSLLAMTSLMK